MSNVGNTSQYSANIVCDCQQWTQFSLKIIAMDVLQLNGHVEVPIKDVDICAVCLSSTCCTDKSPMTIKLECRHTFHLQCCQELIKRKWHGPRITFGFTLCPLCKSKIRHPALKDILDPIEVLEETVQHKAITRLQYDGNEKALAITKPGGLFHQNPGGYAMELYAYYICHKCKAPYFGGEAHCEAMLEMEDKGYKPEDFVCGLCSNILRAQSCAKHGADYISYKCRYCCSVAVFHCFGTTHFCNSCHNDHARLGAIPKADLPKCPVGPKGQKLHDTSCPLNMDHPATGQEFALGCGICLNAMTF